MSRLRLLLSLAVVWIGAHRVAAQVVRLPTVMPASEAYSGRLVSNPDTIEMPGPPAQLADSVVHGQRQPQSLPGARDGIFQKITFDATWLAGGGQNDLGETQLESTVVLGFPAPTRESPLLVTSGFAVHYLDGPVSRDLPARVFDSYVQFRWYHAFGPRWATSLAVTPGVYSDYEQQTDEAFRLTGNGVAIWTWSPAFKLVLGVAYLDRDDLRVLPVGGVIWKPNEEVKFELAVPRPKISRRIHWMGVDASGAEDWAYVAGELGGGIWAYRRRDGRNDVFNIRDYRFILGVERKAPGRLGAHLEIAYVFGRRIDFDTATPALKPADTVMLRVGASY